MLTVLFILLAVIFFSCRPHIGATMLQDGEYVSHKRTTLINGFFIWMVFAGHLGQYNPDYLPCDEVLITYILNNLGQTVVATFFFFSGYGIMYSLRNKKGYAQTLINKRFISLLLHMTLAVLIYLGIQSWYGKGFDYVTILLSFTGWLSLGNSNWFIFITLAGYIITAVSYLLWHKKGETAIAVSTAFLFSVLIYFVQHRGGWWVNSCMCIPAGMLFFSKREKIEQLLARIKIPVWILGAVLVLLGVVTYHLYLPAFFANWLRNISTVSFALGVCLFFSCIRLKRLPRFLCWSGGPALFTLYIFQRIPMIIGKNEGICSAYPQLFILLCFVATLVLGWLGLKCFSFLDKLIFPSGKKTRTQQ